jgi:hypothetical protein
VLAVEQLREREVVALLDARPGVHRDTEARGGRLTAVDRDDEDPAAPGGVVAVDELAAGEDLVLDRDRVQLARAHPDEGERRLVERLLLDDRRAAVRPRAPEPEAGREEELLPRVRPDGVAEARVVLTALKAVGPRLLPVGPADRELSRALELVVDDRAVAHRGAEHPEAPAP